MDDSPEEPWMTQKTLPTDRRQSFLRRKTRVKKCALYANIESRESGSFYSFPEDPYPHTRAVLVLQSRNVIGGDARWRYNLHVPFPLQIMELIGHPLLLPLN